MITQIRVAALDYLALFKEKSSFLCVFQSRENKSRRRETLHILENFKRDASPARHVTFKFLAPREYFLFLAHEFADASKRISFESNRRQRSIEPGSLVRLKIPDLRGLPKRRDKRESRFAVRRNISHSQIIPRGLLSDGGFGNRETVSRDAQSFWWPIKWYVADRPDVRKSAGPFSDRDATTATGSRRRR